MNLNIMERDIKRTSLFSDSIDKDWRNKLRLSMSHEIINRKSFDITQNGILRLANGFEIDNQGVKRAQYNSIFFICYISFYF